MKKLTIEIEKPKYIENLFEEFEDNIIYVSHYSESEFYDFDIKANHFEYLVENKVIENNFQSVINSLKLHLLDQLKNNNTNELISFFQKQEIYFNMFLPDKRKKEIYNQYLTINIASGDESILTSNYILSKYERQFIKLIFDEYSLAYNQLNNELSSLESQFISTPISVQKPEHNPTEKLSIQITHPKRVEIAKAIKAKYSSYKGKEFKILYEALLKLDLFPQKNKRNVFFRCLQAEGYHINNAQILENQYFKKGYKNTKHQYVQSDDEIERDKIIKYLEGIIESK